MSEKPLESDVLGGKLAVTSSAVFTDEDGSLTVQVKVQKEKKEEVKESEKKETKKLSYLTEDLTPVVEKE